MNKNVSYWDQKAQNSKDLYEAVGAGTYVPGERTTRYLQETILRLLRKMDPLHCIDAGCGTGLYIPVLFKHFSRITGMDFSESMLKLAKENLKEYQNVSFTIGNITEMPFEDASVQNIFCKSTIQCMSIRDVEIAFKEFERVLKPGGNLLLHVKNSNTLGVSLSLFKKYITLDLKGYHALKEKSNPANYHEDFLINLAYARPLTLYFKMLEKAGFKYLDMFSFHCYSMKYLHKINFAKQWEFIELTLRKFPITKTLLKKQGIDCYILLKKPEL